MTDEKEKSGFLKVLLSSGLLIAVVGNFFQYRQNIELQQMNTRTERVAEFRNSGSEMDRKLVELFDALSEKAPREAELTDFENAYLDHVLKTEAEREILGAESTDDYLRALNVLNDVATRADSARGAGERIEALSEVIRIRRQISQDALNS